MSEPRHHIFSFVDVEGSSHLSTPDKELVQRQLASIMDASSAKAGIEIFDRQDRGDGYLLVSLTEVPIRQVIASFIETFDTRLAARTVGDVPLRVRLVVHQGDVSRDENGWRGPQLDRAARMVDATEVKAALKASPYGRMAFVVAPELYDSVIRGYPYPNHTDFRRCRLATKEGELQSWVTITGTAEQPGRDADEATAPARTRTPAGHSITQVGTATNSAIGNTVGGNFDFRVRRTGER